uniref:non-specific serine/threonine protein kinase n=1 Tax=Ganoderma boninense TaxID=34458 RepID=A0A5K1JTL6_9APHY|nr:Pectinesterase (EC [Ganoderma boninense]
MKPLASLSALLASAGICLAEILALRSSPSKDLSTRVNILRSEDPRPYAGHGDLELLDIVLVASVDGKLHALNRTSGVSLWSMASSGAAAPAAFGPLVRTEHPEVDPDLTDDGDASQEIYIIEPQTGDIYVMSSPDSPLQRLPFSMAQLVDMSPFSFSGDEDRRVFVGSKETSLLLIELETGKIKATVDPKCPWTPFEDLTETSQDVDLDELDGSKPPKEEVQRTEVYIGRTDYHVAIHTRPEGPGGRTHVQRLTFSAYGPNNQDTALQTLYQRTADNTYIQSLPTGKILSFKTVAVDSAAALPVWSNNFPSPIVTTFDVLRSPKRQQPFVLLQPQPTLQEIFPLADLVTATKHKGLPNLDRAYVGLVEESGSLFAMSPDRFPLVVFGDSNTDRRWYSIDPPPGTSYEDDSVNDFPVDLESAARVAKVRKLREMCRNGASDVRCLTGVRPLGSDSQSRLSRLLDGAPSVIPAPPPSPPYSHSNSNRPDMEVEDRDEDRISDGNGTMKPPVWGNHSGPRIEDRPMGRLLGMDGSTQAISAFGLAAIILLVWMSVKFFAGPSSLPPSPTSASLPESPPAVKMETTKPVTEQDAPAEKPELVANGDAKPTPKDVPTPALDASEDHSSAKKLLFVPDAADTADPLTDAPDDDTEKENEASDTTGKRKGIRRKRGKKKNKGVAITIPTDEVEQVEPTPKPDGPKEPVQTIVLAPPTPREPVVKTLVVSETVLGMGSHGTVVFKGSLQGRAVAVKRMLADFVTLASREVNVLQESDDHPNVIRYYYQEAHANFLYIALELCPASLADVIDHPDQFRDIVVAFEPKRALRQITAGLRHLHALKIIHRDIKPQNILISDAKRGAGENAGHRMLISDFGLCRKLEYDQTSFLPTAHGSVAAGTVGWRAPEILRGEVKLDDASDESQSSRGSVGSVGSSTGTPTGKPTRLTKSVDIFALGCLYYYVLTNGFHPFGDRFEREFNILKNAKSLEGLERFGEEGTEAVDLIDRMLSPEAYERPDTSTCLLHPYFWDPGKRLTFLQDASDRFEIMCRDPKDPNLLALEKGAFEVVGADWHSRLDKLFIDNLGKFRKYDGKSVQDLLRALRNKKHHYQDLPENVKRLLGTMPEGFLAYFTRKFPKLFLHVHGVISSSVLRTESMFRSYYELKD